MLTEETAGDIIVLLKAETEKFSAIKACTEREPAAERHPMPAHRSPLRSRKKEMSSRISVR